jgi:subtilase family serine protease
MGDQQGQGTGQPVNEAAIAAELLSLRRTLYPLLTQEQCLEIQRAQIQEHIARYATQISAARAANNEELARVHEEHRARLQTHLPLIQQQLEAVQQQQAPFLQRQKQLQAQLQTFQSQQQSAAAPLSANWPGKPQRPKKRVRRLVLFASVLMAAALLTLLTLGRASLAPTARSGAAVQPTQQGTARLPTPTATPPPLAFHPNGTAPTSENCLRALGYACYSPEQIQQAFNLTSLYQSGYSGRGQTIVILGAGKTTTLKHDLHQFDLAWGLPDPPSFQILKPQGEPVPYTCSGGYDGLQAENTLDVEWAHAIAPGAKITLLIWPNAEPGTPPDEACGIGDIARGVAYALNNHLGQIISISYGGSELGDVSETAADHKSDVSYYQYADLVFKRAAAERVTILAAAGDTGATNPSDFTKENAYWPKPNVGWPASDPYVLAVGGTTLHTFGDGNYNNESVWNSSYGAAGGGLSAIFSEPAYQKTLPDQTMLQGKRAMPDVSFPAAANYSLYASFQKGEMGQVSARWNHWAVYGGTSASAPCWAGLVALGNEILGVSLGFFHNFLYKLHGRGMHDITSGNNSFGGVTGYAAKPGYDLASGWGTPITDEFFQALYDELNPIQEIPCGNTVVCK